MKFEYFPDSLTRVRCDAGFDVILRWTETLIYREGERQMSLYFESGCDNVGNVVIIVGTKGLKHWLPPHAVETISQAKEAETRSRIQAAIEFMGCKCKFISEE